MNSSYTVFYRPFHQMTRDGWFPGVFAKTNKNDVPYVLLTVIYVIAIVPVLAGYDIKTIEVTDGGSLVIEFANEPSFVAEIKNFKAGEFKYELVAGNGNDVINAEANGKVEFAGTADSPRCRFTIIGKIVNGSTTYTTNIEFVLVKA